MTLSPEFLEKQKKALLDEKARLEERLGRLREYTDYGWDDDSNIQEINDFENNRPLENQVEYLLEKVNKALEAIENGTYGQCTKCSKAIEVGRLEVMPYAEICISCNEPEQTRS